MAWSYVPTEEGAADAPPDPPAGAPALEAGSAPLAPLATLTPLTFLGLSGCVSNAASFIRISVGFSPSTIPITPSSVISFRTEGLCMRARILLAAGREKGLELATP